MEPIRVPAPPPSAFNKGRRISDLIDAQLKHFQHLEKTLKLNLPASIAGDIHTESGAARYIAQITTAIRTRTLGATSAPPVAPVQTAGSVPVVSSADAQSDEQIKAQSKSKKRKNP